MTGRAGVTLTRPVPRAMIRPVKIPGYIRWHGPCHSREPFCGGGFAFEPERFSLNGFVS